MSNDWYVYKEGQQQGPFTWEELWHKASEGKIKPADHVWSQNLPGWTRADQIPQLMPPVPEPIPDRPAPPETQRAAPSVPAKSGGKGGIIALVLVLILIVGLGGAAGIFLLLRGGLPGLGSGSAENTIIGCWSGQDMEEEIFVQFLPDNTINIAFPENGMWTSTSYRLVDENSITFLELYDSDYGEWDRGAEVDFRGKDNLLLKDTRGSLVELNRVSERKFQEVIKALEYTEWY